MCAWVAQDRQAPCACGRFLHPARSLLLCCRCAFLCAPSLVSGRQGSFETGKFTAFPCIGVGLVWLFGAAGPSGAFFGVDGPERACCHSQCDSGRLKHVHHQDGAAHPTGPFERCVGVPARGCAAVRQDNLSERRHGVSPVSLCSATWLRGPLGGRSSRRSHCHLGGRPLHMRPALVSPPSLLARVCWPTPIQRCSGMCRPVLVAPRRHQYPT